MCSNLELKKMYLCKYSYFKDNIPDIILDLILYVSAPGHLLVLSI